MRLEHRHGGSGRGSAGAEASRSWGDGRLGLHLVARQLARRRDVVEAHAAVGGRADALEQRLGEAHQRDLLLEEVGVLQQRRLRLELLVVRRHEHLHQSGARAWLIPTE